MRKIGIILITAILLIIVIRLCLSLDVNALDRIEKAGSLISAFAAVITLILALLLFEKYGVEKNVLAKNIDRIEKLTEELRKISLQLNSSDFLLQVIPLQKAHFDDVYGYNKKAKNFLIVVDSNYSYSLNSITCFATDPFIPKEIAEAIKKIEWLYGSNLSNESKEMAMRTVKVKVIPTVKIDETVKDEYIFFNSFYPPKEAITLEQYVNLWNGLGKSIKKWMKKHSNTNADLNIDV